MLVPTCRDSRSLNKHTHTNAHTHTHTSPHTQRGEEDAVVVVTPSDEEEAAAVGDGASHADKKQCIEVFSVVWCSVV
jgi:hypothetical protein